MATSDEGLTGKGLKASGWCGSLGTIAGSAAAMTVHKGKVQNEMKKIIHA